jgi:hypothetical protein
LESSQGVERSLKVGKKAFINKKPLDNQRIKKGLCTLDGSIIEPEDSIMALTYEDTANIQALFDLLRKEGVMTLIDNMS